MSEYLDDPSVLTKDKLKSELLAHNVELPSGNHNKDVYVQLYLKNLTAQNKKHVTAVTLDAFSSDEELPPPTVVSSRSRSSGRKATRKTDKVQLDELDVTLLTDESLRDKLLEYGVDAGPIVASTRKLYEKKLQKLLDDGPVPLPLPQLVLTDIQVNHNGNSESDLYSDKEDEVTEVPVPEPVAEPEPEPEPEPAPMVERPVRSRGKTPVTTRTRSSQHHRSNPLMDEQDEEIIRRVKRRSRRLSHTPLQEEQLVRHLPKLNKDTADEPVSLLNTAQLKVEKIAASDQTPKVEEKDILKELFSNDINSPTGISATCRRPIRGAAGRPVISSDLWNDENTILSPKTKTSSYSFTETHTVNRVPTLPLSSSSTSSTSFTTSTSSSSSRLLSAAPPAGQTKAVRRSMSLWIKLFLLAIVAAFLFLVYQAMETNSINPFASPEAEVASGSAA